MKQWSAAAPQLCKRLAKVAAHTLWACIPLLHAEECVYQAQPVVVELFTSQGCSSCPPAEDAVSALAVRPGVLALAFHVDYWDALGWRDPFSLPESTRRQEGYARALQLRTIATPQLIVDGQEMLMGSRQIHDTAIRNPRPAPAPLVLAISQGHVIVHIDARPRIAPSEVTFIPYLARATTAVHAGENIGRTLTETNIALGYRALGPWRGADFDARIALTEVPAAATHVAVLIQQRGQRAILGAGCIALP